MCVHVRTFTLSTQALEGDKEAVCVTEQGAGEGRRYRERQGGEERGRDRGQLECSFGRRRKRRR